MTARELLRAIRSTLAHGIGCVLWTVEPVAIRLRRFAFECWARSLLRGRVALGVQFVGLITVEGEGLVDIGPGSRIGRHVFFETYDGARIEIGRQVTINDGVMIVAYRSVRIGSHTMIGEYSSIRDANHGARQGAYVHDQPHDAAPLALGEDCWIGRGVIVCKGVTLGNGVVVAANSVVNQNFPDNAIVGGIPAKLLGERQP